MSTKKTKKRYEEFLNSIAPSRDSEEWIIGGKWRNRMQYGTAIRKHDPIAFECGYRDFLN